VVCYEGKRRTVVKHIGSARDEGALAVLLSEAEHYIQSHNAQPSLFTAAELQSQLHIVHFLARRYFRILIGHESTP
jgi:hypothetical protein